MKRGVFILSVILVATLLLAACGGSDSGSPGNTPSGRIEVLCMDINYWADADADICNITPIEPRSGGIVRFEDGEEMDLTKGVQTVVVLNNTTPEPYDVTYIIPAFVNGCGGGMYTEGNATVPAKGTHTVFHGEDSCGGILNSPGRREIAVYNGHFILPDFGYIWYDEWQYSFNDDWEWALVNSHVGEAPAARGELSFIHNSP